jgi:malonyl-CoA O-methyltransferase
MSDSYQLDPRAVRRAFDKAAATYDQAAALQDEVRNRLLERLTLVRRMPETILDLGAGTGVGARALRDSYARAQVIALDASIRMLDIARQRQRLFRKFDRLCADAGALPLRDGSIDWCISNLMLPWCDPPDAVFREVRRVLRPGGLFTFTTFGPDSLTELRCAWSKIDSDEHVHRFIDMHDLGDALLRSGFAEPVMDVERIVLTYPSADQLMVELKNSGSVTATVARVRHVGSKSKLNALKRAYDSNDQGRVSATFEVIFGHAWNSEHESHDRHAMPENETRIPVSALRGSRRRI